MTHSEFPTYFQFPENLWSKEGLVKHYFISTKKIFVICYSVCIYRWHVGSQCLISFFKWVFLQNFNFSTVFPTPCITHLHLHLHLYEDATLLTHTVIWPTHIHTLWLARQPASFMKSFLSDAALSWTHASFWADITQSASQQLPDFLLTRLHGLILCRRQRSTNSAALKSHFCVPFILFRQEKQCRQRYIVL